MAPPAYERIYNHHAGYSGVSAVDDQPENSHLPQRQASRADGVSIPLTQQQTRATVLPVEEPFRGSSVVPRRRPLNPNVVPIPLTEPPNGPSVAPKKKSFWENLQFSQSQYASRHEASIPLTEPHHGSHTALNNGERRPRGSAPSRFTRLMLDGWFWESLAALLSLATTFAIVIVLSQYQGKPVPHFSYGVTVRSTQPPV